MKLLVILLTVLFVGLKLGHVIAWSWWVVFAPLIALIAIGILVVVAAIAVYAAESAG